MGPRRLSIAVLACVALCAAASTAHAAHPFKPRIKGALGIVPPLGHQEIASSSNAAVVYHGGLVMHHVTVHTVFWAPPGFRFDGAPSLLAQGYKQLIEQFLADVARDSGAATNEFSLLNQYPDYTGAGNYSISYSPAQDSLDVSDPYPPAGKQCGSPSDTATCVTALQVEQELDNVISARDPAGRGLHDLWLVFLPPDVDTCVAVQSCATNVYGGYHSLANFGHGPDIYALIPDPLIEATPGQGTDPEGNPEAEQAIDVAGHELAEAITDPEGTGWLDPSGFEIGDKCETGPQEGTPLGFALDGSPYNEVIGRHEYLLQTMWSNVDTGCKQRSPVTVPAPGIASVSLRQFSGRITGIATPGVSVTVRLIRGPVVARGTTRAGPNGAWRLTLAHALGDDRDEISIRYGRGGPPSEDIATGNGGDPYSEAGFTGWYDLDSGFAVFRDGVLISPCAQVGVLSIVVHRAASAPPIERCETETDVAPVKTARIGPGTPVTLSSEDNRAPSPGNPYGALVKLTIPLGEPGSAPSLNNGQVPFLETGFPTCTADLETERLSCDGLVPGEHYTVLRRRGNAHARVRANAGGAIHVSDLRGPLSLTGGDVITLRNFKGRTLTVLHVAHLRVHLVGGRAGVASGTCQSGDWWGAMAPPMPSSLLAILGLSPAGPGRVCPLKGNAHGLPASDIEQTDDRSGGVTRTDVPDLIHFSPSDGAELYGPFVALAQLKGHAVGMSASLTISQNGRRVFSAGGVDGGTGVDVPALPRGAYSAAWVVRDQNGDTRTVHSTLIEAG